MTAPGSGMSADIGEQPEVYARLLEPAQADAFAKVAAAIAERRPRHVVFTARGTSDHAALYGTYLVETRLGLPAGLASPSTVTLFGARPALAGALVVGVSQSGASPDLCEVLVAARDSGAQTLAVTNRVDSPLAQIADLVVDVCAGRERAVAATKTYTAELLALLLLIEGIRAGDGQLPAGERAFLRTLPDLAARTLSDSAAGADTTPGQLASRYRFASRLVTTGRGYAYPTVREAAHKVMETSYLPALAYSGADLLHGPLAVTDPDVPVLAVVGSGPGGLAMREVLARIRDSRAEVVAVAPADVDGIAARLPVPDVDERYSPLLDILPLQRLALALAVQRGEDPDAPRSITKITATR